jgi:hypothetical protein
MMWFIVGLHDVSRRENKIKLRKMEYYNTKQNKTCEPNKLYD